MEFKIPKHNDLRDANREMQSGDFSDLARIASGIFKRNDPLTDSRITHDLQMGMEHDPIYGDPRRKGDTPLPTANSPFHPIGGSNRQNNAPERQPLPQKAVTANTILQNLTTAKDRGMAVLTLADGSTQNIKADLGAFLLGFLQSRNYENNVMASLFKNNENFLASVNKIIAFYKRNGNRF